MLSWLEGLLLGAIQGIAEWLPISSSSHLRLAGTALGKDVPPAFVLLLHAGTLAAVALTLRSRIAAMTRALARGLAHPKQSWRIDPDFRLAALLAIATLPAAAAGAFLDHALGPAADTWLLLGIGFLATAAILATTHWAKPQRPLEAARPADAAAIGLLQVLAVLPGVSRSGMTIAAGTHAGLDRAAAVEFSFLLSIPTILGALAFKAPELAQLGDIGYGAIAAGLLASFSVGILTIGFLLSWVTRRGLMPFAAYDGVVGLGIVVAASL